MLQLHLPAGSLQQSCCKATAGCTAYIEPLCRKIFVSHSRLHGKLHALEGCSPNQFVRMVRLAKAQGLLLSSGESIAAIALAGGFSDPGYFARVFRQEFGCTPQEWKSR